MNTTCLAIDPSQTSTIYAGLDSAFGIYKSVNGGASWTVATNGLCVSESSKVYSLAVDPRNSMNVFAGTTCGLYRSTNGGALWTATSVSGEVYAVAADPVTSGVVYAGSVSGLYKSLDGGNTFVTGAGLISAVYCIAINPSAPANIFAGTYNSGIYQSTNGGTNWYASGLEFGEVQSLVIDPHNPSVLYASEVTDGESYGVYQSVNGGTNWSGANTGIPGYQGYQFIYCLAVDPLHAGVVYTGTTFNTENAYVAKLDSTGSFFVYADYLGGTKGNYPQYVFGGRRPGHRRGQFGQRCRRRADHLHRFSAHQRLPELFL